MHAGVVVVVALLGVVVVVACGIVVVVVRRSIVLVGVVVGVTSGQVAPPHASQQLGWSPTQARPRFGALHAAALRLMPHFCTLCAFVRQQVTNPVLPHVDRAAHLMTAPLHSFGSVVLAFA